MLRGPWPLAGVILGHRHAAVRAVEIEIFHRDQLRTGGSRARQDAALEGRELLGPAVVVARVGAVVDVGGPSADLAGIGRVGGIAAHDLDGGRQVLACAAVGDDADTFTLLQEDVDHRRADRAIAVDDVQLGC